MHHHFLLSQQAIALVTKEIVEIAAFHKFLALVVTVSYVMFTVGLILVVVRGHKRRSWGMPPLSAVSTGGICLLCLAGPTLEPDLFPNPAPVWFYISWVSWLVPLAVIFYQHHRFGDTGHAVTIGLILSFIGGWSYIDFYQCYYVNVLSPIATFGMSLGYVLLAFRPPLSAALSVPAAWLMAIGTLGLYGATVLGGMPASYPRHEGTGYSLLYFLFVTTVVFLFIYAYKLTAFRKGSAGVAASA